MSPDGHDSTPASRKPPQHVCSASPAGDRPCAACGEMVSAGTLRCPACRQDLSAEGLDRLGRVWGNWFVWDRGLPTPGVRFDMLSRQAARGELGAEVVIRGPGTRQQWTTVARVPGLSHLVGCCHACGAPAKAREAQCATCHASFEPLHESTPAGPAGSPSGMAPAAVALPATAPVTRQEAHGLAVPVAAPVAAAAQPAHGSNEGPREPSEPDLAALRESDELSRAAFGGPGASGRIRTRPSRQTIGVLTIVPIIVLSLLVGGAGSWWYFVGRPGAPVRLVAAGQQGPAGQPDRASARPGGPVADAQTGNRSRPMATGSNGGNGPSPTPTIAIADASRPAPPGGIDLFGVRAGSTGTPPPAAGMPTPAPTARVALTPTSPPPTHASTARWVPADQPAASPTPGPAAEPTPAPVPILDLPDEQAIRPRPMDLDAHRASAQAELARAYLAAADRLGGSARVRDRERALDALLLLRNSLPRHHWPADIEQRILMLNASLPVTSGTGGGFFGIQSERIRD